MILGHGRQFLAVAVQRPSLPSEPRAMGGLLLHCLAPATLEEANKVDGDVSSLKEGSLTSCPTNPTTHL